MPRADSATVFRFGDFVLDLRARTLHKRGVRLRVHYQPFEVLLLFLERPGEVVTREDLQQRLWPADTFVDFENGLNAAIKKLRQALGDSTEAPRYIETVPRIGYRFIAPVDAPGAELRESSPEVAARIVPAPAVARSAAVEALPGQRSRGSLAPRRTRSYKVQVFFGGGALVLLALITLIGYEWHRVAPASTARPLTEKDTIVLADFANTTGDSVFDETLRQGMAVELEQSPFLSLISEERIQHVLRLMGQSPGTRLTPEIARELCDRTGSAVVLDGSIARLGSQYVLGLRATNCTTGDILDEEQAQAARKEQVLAALSQIASKFRTRVGESLATVEKHNTPLAEATTPSLAALKSYSTALKVLFSTGSAAALPLFQRATEIDPQFAAAHAYLGRMYDDLGETALSAESTDKAYQLRERASDAEKFFITASYDMQVTGDMEKAEQTCESWIQSYPREMIPHSFLSGIIVPALGAYERGVEEGKQTIQLDPDFAIGYSVLAFSYEYLGRVGDAENVLQKASERKLEIPDFLIQRYDIAFLKGDPAGMQREVALARGKSGVQDWVSNHQAFALAYLGRLQEARDASRTAVNFAQQEGQRERASLYEAGAALRESFFGNAAEARQHANAALRLSQARDTVYGAAVALALAGDLSKAHQLAQELEKRYSANTSVQFSYLPTLRALSELNRGEASRAIESLQTSAPNELGAPSSSFSGFFGALYPVYVRGLAYLAKHQDASAALEFQKILDHRGIVVSDPIGALAYLQLGRAFAQSGDKAKATSAYQDFLTLWKNADRNIPALKQAKEEYARLR